MAISDDLLRSIDAKLTALLALVIDGYLRDRGAARPRWRSVDEMLTSNGLSAVTVGKLLGKTERAVHLQLQSDKKKKSGGRPSKHDTKGR